MNAQVEEKKAWIPSGSEGIGEEAMAPAPSTNNDNGNDDPEDKPEALPLFEVRIEGIGPLAVEAVSQAALVDYITHLAYTESPSVFFPFRVEYVKAIVDQQRVVDRSIIYLDPSRIILVGPEREPLAYVKPDPNQDFAYIVPKSGGSGPAEVIVLADETEDGASPYDDASPKDEDDPE